MAHQVFLSNSEPTAFSIHAFAKGIGLIYPNYLTFICLDFSAKGNI